LTAFSRLIAQVQAQRSSTAQAAPNWSATELARRISWLIDRGAEAEDKMSPMERARMLVSDTFPRVGELVEADPDAARYLAERFAEAAEAIREDAGH
jgi:hypothetical protein